MCLVMAIITLVLSYNFFMAQNHLAAFVSLVVAVAFIVFMIRNILYVRNLKKEKKHDN